MKEIISIPNASRTFDALRSLDYTLNSSIADIIDNAITAKVSAKNIRVYFGFESPSSIVCRIQDDGIGMSSGELEEAMRLGTDTTYKETDLGKFGMGMKTASLSQCNILTIISKNKKAEISGFRWDIGHIKANKNWTLLKLTSAEIEKLLKKEKINLGEHGTVVLWNDLFWINEGYNSYTNEKLAQNFFFRHLEHLKLHLRTVYHRFLDGSLSTRKSIHIYVNGNSLQPWDPYCRQEAGTEELSLKKHLSEFTIPGYKSPIRIEGFILPNKEGFSSEEAWKEAKGLLSWNDSQGYYIYRANRIIRLGGWHGTKAKDEHDKLARISIDIDPSLDELFRITVDKSRVQFPELLFQHLKNEVNPAIVRKAKQKYKTSKENLTVNNNFRKNEIGVSKISKELLSKSNIKTKAAKNGIAGGIEVQNPSGTWLSNKINEFLKYGSDKDYEIVSAPLADEKFWKIICNKDDKFKIIVNSSHPFYLQLYRQSTNKAITDALDALIFSLAFAELYNKNDQNAHLFDSFKTICSQALKKLIKEKII